MSNMRIEYDATANDSDKSFTPDSLTIWEISHIYVNLATTATVGNRILTVEIQDESSNVVYKVVHAVTQAASLTYTYEYFAGAPREAAVVSNSLMVPIPERLRVLHGHSIRIYDSAAVDAAADDMIVAIHYKELKA